MLREQRRHAEALLMCGVWRWREGIGQGTEIA